MKKEWLPSAAIVVLVVAASWGQGPREAVHWTAISLVAYVIVWRGALAYRDRKLP